MNIEFEYIEVQNFKSVGDPIIINYKDFNGLNFVIGNNLDQPGAKNGSGKSVLLVDCLIFALFGKTAKPTSNQNLINRYYKKKAETYVKLTFKCNNIRYRSECHCHKSSLKMFLYKEDNTEESGWLDITQSSIIKTKQYIQEEILKCSYDVFKSAIVIASSDCLNFYNGMTKQQKRAYIENIFNLDCFGLMQDEIKTDMNYIKKEISFSNNELISCGQQIDDLTKKLNQYNEDLNNKSNKLKEQILEEANIYKEKSEYKAKLEKAQSKFSNIQESYENILSTEQKSLKDKSLIEREIFQAKTKIESINNIISEVQNLTTGLCSKCSDVINNRYDMSKHLNNIDVLKKQITENTIKLNKNNEQHTLILEEKNNLKSDMTKKEKIDAKLIEIKYDIGLLASNIKKLKSDLNDINTNTINPYSELLESANKNLEEMQLKINDLNIKFKHLDILKTVCSENGVKQIIIKDIIILLNSLIQKYLNEIGADYIVCFDESFDFKFITLEGECEYNNFSSGEQQRIQIATLLAFRDLILNGKINSNILVIDELLDMAIDSIAIKKIINILQAKTIDLNQALFIISHRSEITDENIFQHIIEVTKKNGLTSINII